MNTQEIRRLYSVNPIAKELLDHAATRKNHVKATSVDRLLENLPREGMSAVSRSGLIEVLRYLEAFGCGQFKVGRRGQPSRFEWDVEIGEVGKAARGEVTADPSVGAPPAVTHEPSSNPPAPDAIAHSFRLRPSFVLTFELPADLTFKEAGRIAEFVKTLPFGDPDV